MLSEPPVVVSELIRVRRRRAAVWVPVVRLTLAMPAMPVATVPTPGAPALKSRFVVSEATAVVPAMVIWVPEAVGAPMAVMTSVAPAAMPRPETLWPTARPVASVTLKVVADCQLAVRVISDGQGVAEHFRRLQGGEIARGAGGGERGKALARAGDARVHDHVRQDGLIERVNRWEWRWPWRVLCWPRMSPLVKSDALAPWKMPPVAVFVRPRTRTLEKAFRVKTLVLVRVDGERDAAGGAIRVERDDGAGTEVQVIGRAGDRLDHGGTGIAGHGEVAVEEETARAEAVVEGGGGVIQEEGGSGIHRPGGGAGAERAGAVEHDGAVVHGQAVEHESGGRWNCR